MTIDPGSDGGADGTDPVEVAAAILGSLARRDEPLAPFCTYRVGGAAALFVEPTSVADLEVVRDAVAESGCPTMVVGKGSNLLVADRGFPGVVVHLDGGTGGGAFDQIEIDLDAERPTVRAGAGAFLPVVARRTAAAGLTGFEWAVGVPGSIGGAVRMNAGGHGSDMAANLTRVSVFDLREGGPREWKPDDLRLGYRRSAIEAHHLVLFAELTLDRGDRETAEAEISEIVRWRRANQPGGQNAGSVFANPDGDSAGRLIDACGLKGFRVGTAEVSTKHANFIQADPAGSADDVYRLIRQIRLRVAAATGIELHPENLLVGFEDAGLDRDTEPSDGAGLDTSPDIGEGRP